jgi:hypothetical protein
MLILITTIINERLFYINILDYIVKQSIQNPHIEGSVYENIHTKLKESPKNYTI